MTIRSDIINFLLEIDNLDKKKTAAEIAAAYNILLLVVFSSVLVVY